MTRKYLIYIISLLLLATTQKASAQLFYGGMSDKELREEYAKLTTRRLQLVEQLQQYSAEFKEKWKKLETGSSWIDQNLVPKISELSTDAVKLRVELAGLKARGAAVEKAVEQQMKGAIEEVNRDEITEQLQELVKLKEAAVALARENFKNGTVPQSGVRTAEGNLIETRIKLAERREAIAARNITPVTARLRDQLIELTVSINETQAKLDGIQQLVERANLMVRISELERSIPHVREEIKEVESQLRVLTTEHPAATQPAK